MHLFPAIRKPQHHAGLLPRHTPHLHTGKYALLKCARHPRNIAAATAGNALPLRLPAYRQKAVTVEKSDQCSRGELSHRIQSDFATPSTYDRVSPWKCSNTGNWESLLARVATWMKSDGKLFIHIFTHRQFAYPYEVRVA